jgi:hypothetical protein
MRVRCTAGEGIAGASAEADRRCRLFLGATAMLCVGISRRGLRCVTLIVMSSKFTVMTSRVVIAASIIGMAAGFTGADTASARRSCGAANFYGYPVYDIGGSNLSCRTVRRLGIRWGHTSLSRLTRTGRGCDRISSRCKVGLYGRTYSCVAKRHNPLPRVYCRSGSHIGAWSLSGDL